MQSLASFVALVAAVGDAFDRHPARDELCFGWGHALECDRSDVDFALPHVKGDTVSYVYFDVGSVAQVDREGWGGLGDAPDCQCQPVPVDKRLFWMGSTCSARAESEFGNLLALLLARGALSPAGDIDAFSDRVFTETDDRRAARLRSFLVHDQSELVGAVGARRRVDEVSGAGESWRAGDPRQFFTLQGFASHQCSDGG